MRRRCGRCWMVAMRACPDVNVLIHAANPASTHGDDAREYLRRSLTSGLLLLPDVASSFCRIVTNRRIFADPSSMEQARSVIDALLGRAGVSLAAPSAKRLALMFRLCQAHAITGDEVADAYLVAGAMDVGAVFITYDQRLARLGPDLVRILP